ncbi:transcriptional regulator TyrR [uncultured Paraglaciecola sp.]|uniref:transcriptional regulator TyrR n=1 Tax=uncultured Paraglaciecola sp. TaxID=1765024 RepID=UPI002613032C|nr:transcriptional regulator TyrR [uncultured Paraglaciecola sp.]
MRLEVNCQDRLGIAQDVLDILVEHEIDLRGIEIDEQGKIYLNFPNIEFADFQHLMPKIRKIEGIEDVKTTPFMPIEREQYQLKALLQTLPDPVFSVDTKGKIILINEAVISNLDIPKGEIIGSEIGEFLKGFNVTRWLECNNPQAQAQRIRFLEQDYLVDMLPVMVPNSDDADILAGAVFMLKSELRLGQQLTVFHKASPDSFLAIQAESKAMKNVVKEAKRLAELDEPIIIFGETGAGKQILAKACHEASRRNEYGFLTFNCAASADVAEAELFGIVADPGTQTEDKAGLLELVQGGTLLINEVADLSIELQVKLLQVLQSGRYRKIGDEKDLLLDARIMCTTQKDLGKLIQEGQFRADLFYRLNVLNLVLPPLRERKSDIVALAERFIKQHSVKLGRKAPKMTKACSHYLQTYPWPGNVRQLENALYRAVSLLEGSALEKEQIQLPSCSETVSFVSQEFTGSLDDEVKRFEKDILMRLYPSFPSTRQLAKKLGLSHTAVANKLRDYGINKKTVKIV